MPVTSYAPEFLELYRKASQETVVIKLKTLVEAHRLRSRLHSLRRAMRKEAHSLTTIADGVIISLDTTKEGAILTAKPADKQFLAYLEAAGITIGELDDITPLFEDDEFKNVQEDEQLSQFFRGEKKT